MDAIEKRIERETLFKHIPLVQKELSELEEEYNRKINLKREYLIKLQWQLRVINQS